jgi:hypothetical protein
MIVYDEVNKKLMIRELKNGLEHWVEANMGDINKFTYPQGESIGYKSNIFRDHVTAITDMLGDKSMNDLRESDRTTLMQLAVESGTVNVFDSLEGCLDVKALFLEYLKSKDFKGFSETMAQSLINGIKSDIDDALKSSYLDSIVD